MEVEINYFLKKPSFLYGFREINEDVQLVSFKNDDLIVNLTQIGEAYDNIHTTESLFIVGEQMHNLYEIMKIEKIMEKKLIKAFKTIELPLIREESD